MATARVLVVDDEAVYLDATSRLLTRAGYTVVPAAKARQALEITRTAKVDLIISDALMPDIQGRELLEIIGQTAPEMGRILMSAIPQVPPLDVAFLRKPFRVHELTATVEQVLAAAKQAQENSARAVEQASSWRSSPRNCATRQGRQYGGRGKTSIDRVAHAATETNPSGLTSR